MKVGKGGGEREMGTGWMEDMWSPKRKRSISFHLLTVSSCLIQPQDDIMSALIKVSVMFMRTY